MAKATDPIVIGKRTAKNRVTMAPTVKFIAGEDGKVTEDFVAHYAERAKHECAFICVEATCITPEGRLAPSQLGLWEDGQIEGHKRLTDACHEYGALVVPQIHHGGVGTHPACGPAVGPSALVRESFGRKQEIKELSREDIRRIVSLFADAAVRAQKAGYDGVQLHACHSYLINDFASALNKREDEYGGSAVNRARFGCEVIRAIRASCGEDFIISARVSGCDPTVEDAVIAADEYVKAGCDYLQVSSGIAPLDSLEHDESLPYNKTASLGVRLRAALKPPVPVSLVNGIRTPEQVAYLLSHDLIDTVDLACGLLADPAFTEAILYGAPYHKCLTCRGCGFGPIHNHLCPAMVARGADEFHFRELLGKKEG